MATAKSIGALMVSSEGCNSTASRVSCSTGHHRKA